MVDLTGFADRGTGTYNMVRSAGLGYFFGKDEVCQHLSEDGMAYCDKAIDMLLKVNENKLGKLRQPIELNNGDDKIHPLLDR